MESTKSRINGKFTLVILFLSFFCSTSVLARPLTTDDVGITELGKFALELGFDFKRQDNHDRVYNPSWTLTYGLLERMEVGVGGGYLFFQPKKGENENGFADTQLKVKYRLTNEKPWIPSFGVKGTLKIPTASESKGLGSGDADFNIEAIATKNFGKHLVISLNLGYTFNGEVHVDNDLTYGISATFALSDKWALLGEVFGSHKLNGNSKDRPLSGFIGTNYMITKDITWDAGIELGMNKAAPDYRVTTGLTILFKPPFNPPFGKEKTD